MTTNVYNSNNSELKIQLVCALMDFVSCAVCNQGYLGSFFLAKEKKTLLLLRYIWK